MSVILTMIRSLILVIKYHAYHLQNTIISYTFQGFCFVSPWSRILIYKAVWLGIAKNRIEKRRSV
jgi:hypothetical protein